MYIEVEEIGSKGLVLNDRVALDENQLIEEESFFVEEIDYVIHLSREGKQIKAKGNINTMVSLPCVKCLEPFDLKIDSDFDIILFPVELIEITNSSLNPEDMEYIFFDGDRIDLAKILMEQVNLFIPYKPLCSPNCKGLCPYCGINLNYESCLCEDSPNEVNFLFDKIKR
jgi:uncharacterized protein